MAPDGPEAAPHAPVPTGDEGRFRELLDRLTQTVFEFDLEGRFVYVNQTGLEKFGYSADELRQGLSALDMVVPEQRDSLRANIGRRLAGGQPEHIEYKARRRDGSTFPALVHTVVVVRVGRPVGLQGYLIDISERVQAEKALAASERKYKTLVETTATGFVILDAKGCVLDANAEYGRMAGHRVLEEIRGRSVMDWTAKHDQDRNAQAMRDCLAQGFVRDLQIDYVHASGVIVPVLINATVTEVEGSVQVIALTRDVSDRKRLEEELLRSEKLRSVGVLAGGIAHDFNNILTAILGNISLLRATLRSDGQARELLSEAEQASLRARELTQQLLTFSHGGDPVRRAFVPDALIRESVALAMRGRASACEFKLAADVRPIVADEGQIGQVIRNLVLNASQAMDGGGTVMIEAANRLVRDGEVHGLQPGEYVSIAIADQGVGISEENLSRIFDPYFTTKTEGRGLGLAVSYSIVANHGGAIAVASKVGRGSTFTILLPVARDAEPRQPAIESRLVTGRGRVLVMDDEESVRKIAGKIIEALGYEVGFARDGREAIDAWQRARAQGRPFDVVIMDLTVPGGMGGRQAIRELLAIDPGAKAIVSSGYSSDPVMANFRESGFHDVIAKPYSVADISQTLAALVRS